MWYFGVIIFVLLVIHQIESAIPANLKPCSKSNNFKACALEHGNAFLPFLLNGYPELKIPNLLPLKFSRVDVKSGANLKISLADVSLFGLETVTLTDIDIDFNKLTAFLSIHARELQIIGKYEVDGNILVLPITGSGPINITAVDSELKYTFSAKLEKRGNNEYIKVQDDDKLEYKIGKVYFQLDNLFNGNQIMGDNINKFLNENDQEVLAELGGVIEGTVTSIVRTVSGGILEDIPFHEMFLD